MAEILIQAKDHWTENLSPSEINKLEKEHPGFKAKRERRNVKGCPIVVKPDGWKWGKRECLPDYVVIQIPDMTIEEALAYLEPEFDTSVDPRIFSGYPKLKQRKHRFSVLQIDSMVEGGQDRIILSKSVAQSLIGIRVI